MNQGDPRLILTKDGATLQFRGGQPLLDRGLENLVLISLFTQPGWCGNSLMATPIGSDFEEACDAPITRQALNRIRMAAETALDTPILGAVTVTVGNPTGHRLDVGIRIERTGSALKLSREGGAWYYQTNDPAYKRIIPGYPGAEVVPPTESLIMEFVIAAGDLTLAIPCGDLGVYDAAIDWGDSSATTAVAYNSAGLSHTYAGAGTYIIKVSGTLPWLNFSSNSTEADKLGKVLSLGSVGAMSYQGILGGCSNLTWLGQMGTEAFPDVTSMAGAFSGDTALANLDVSSWNFENILDLTNFATGVAIPTAIYEATLISLAAQDVNSGLTVDFGNSIPESDAAMAARTFLIETKSWVILDWYLGPKIKLSVPLATVSVGTVVIANPNPVIDGTLTIPLATVSVGAVVT